MSNNNTTKVQAKLDELINFYEKQTDFVERHAPLERRAIPVNMGPATLKRFAFQRDGHWIYRGYRLEIVGRTR